MAEDLREAILSRLEALMAFPGVQVSRNVLVDDDEDGAQPPRITILEGDELANENDPTTRPANAPRVVFMHPQILISVFAKSADLGTQLSTLRGKVMQAIATDDTLIGLTLNGRGGRYIGMESDLSFARAMSGKMAMKFQFVYVLRPDQFA